MAMQLTQQDIIDKFYQTHGWKRFAEFETYYLRRLTETLPDTIYYKNNGEEIKIPPINHFPELEEYEVWMEGYRVTGEDGPAQLLGKAFARNFAQACHIIQCEAFLANVSTVNNIGYKSFWDGRWLYDADALTMWGCRLFWSEELARKSFG